MRLSGMSGIAYSSWFISCKLQYFKEAVLFAVWANVYDRWLKFFMTAHVVTTMPVFQFHIFTCHKYVSDRKEYRFAMFTLDQAELVGPATPETNRTQRAFYAVVNGHGKTPTLQERRYGGNAGKANYSDSQTSCGVLRRVDARNASRVLLYRGPSSSYLWLGRKLLCKLCIVSKPAFRARHVRNTTHLSDMLNSYSIFVHFGGVSPRSETNIGTSSSLLRMASYIPAALRADSGTSGDPMLCDAPGPKPVKSWPATRVSESTELNTPERTECCSNMASTACCSCPLCIWTYTSHASTKAWAWVSDKTSL